MNKKEASEVNFPYWLPDFESTKEISTFICVDIETSGLDSFRNEIITLSMSACDREKEIESIELTFRPSSKFWDDSAEKIHGISKFSANRFENQSASNKNLLGFMQKFPNSILVCHSLFTGGYFDWRFLQAHFEKLNMRHELYKSIRQVQSTLTWCKFLNQQGIRSYSKFNLSYLSSLNSIPLNHHDAKSDREACQKLFWMAISDAPKSDCGLGNSFLFKK